MEINKFNNMPLPEVRKAIIKLLLEKDNDFDRQLLEARERLNTAERNMVTARADGDASENSALEKAIEDIRRIHGEIDSIMVLKGRLDNITESEYLRGKYDYDSIVSILESAKVNPTGFVIATDLLNILPNKENINEGIRNVKAKDVELIIIKYAAYDSKDSLCNEDKELLLLLDSLYNISKLRKYKPTGICLEYSTVRVLINDGNTETIFTGFLCPEGISFIEDGIFAANSQLGKLLIGNSMSTNKFINGNITYRLLELY